MDRKGREEKARVRVVRARVSRVGKREDPAAAAAAEGECFNVLSNRLAAAALPGPAAAVKYVHTHHKGL